MKIKSHIVLGNVPYFGLHWHLAVISDLEFIFELCYIGFWLEMFSVFITKNGGVIGGYFILGLQFKFFLNSIFQYFNIFFLYSFFIKIFTCRNLLSHFLYFLIGFLVFLFIDFIDDRDYRSVLFTQECFVHVFGLVSELSHYFHFLIQDAHIETNVWCFIFATIVFRPHYLKSSIHCF